MSTAFLGPHFASNFLLVPLSCSSSSDTYCNPLHISLYSSSLLATNNFLSPALSSSTFLYVWLLVHYDTTKLFLPLILHSSVHTLYPLSTLYLLFVSSHYFYFCFLHLFYYSNYFLILTPSFFYIFYYTYLRFFYYYFM